MGKRTRTVTAAILGAGLTASLVAGPVASASIPEVALYAAGTTTGSLGSLENLPALPTPPSENAPSSSDRDRAESQLKTKINDYRVRMGLPSVTWNAALDTSARWWSDQIANRGKVGHSPGSTRPYTYGGENVWYGDGTPRDQAPDRALQAWINSPGHNSNLKARGVARAGLGMAWDDVKKRWIATYQFETP